MASKGGVDKFYHNGKKQTDEISCKLSFNGILIMTVLPLPEMLFIIKEEALDYYQNDWNITNHVEL
ncbi:MAG: hypothetical protein LBL90_12060 [Prevotellaceae bacterium]|nr:hypothetical protein [Prevotellaceae bacterium]